MTSQMLVLEEKREPDQSQTTTYQQLTGIIKT